MLTKATLTIRYFTPAGPDPTKPHYQVELSDGEPRVTRRVYDPANPPTDFIALADEVTKAVILHPRSYELRLENSAFEQLGDNRAIFRVLEGIVLLATNLHTEREISSKVRDIVSH